jgi:hypothetical protein
MSRHTFGFAVRAMIFFLFSQAAPVAILLSALFSERYSLGARWVFSFSRCCYLISVLSSHLFGGSWALDGMRRPVSSGMRYAPNVGRAQGTKKETGLLIPSD